MSFISTYAYRWFGIFECSRECLRSNWVELSWRPGLALKVYNHSGEAGSRYGLNIHLGWPDVFVKLPWRRKQELHWGSFGTGYGFSFFEKSVHLNWGEKTKIIDMPWASGICVRSSTMLKDGTWINDPKWNRIGDKDAYWARRSAHEEYVRQHRWEEEYPYRYVLKSGEVQERTATVNVEEREWRQHWLKWTRLFANVQRTISVNFSDEVGERSGSWKGGCMGCSYELRPDETPEQCLRRMELERKF